MVRSLSTAVVRLAMAVACSSWLSAAAQAQGARVELLCASAGVDTGSEFEMEVRINLGSNVLGAYTVAIVHDPAVFSVTGVAGGQTEQFSLLPTVNPADFSTGRTRISAINTAGLTEPTGGVRVAEVGLSVLSAVGKSATIEVEVITLADVDGVRIEEVTTQPCTVSFASGTPRATFTEAATSPTPSPVSTPPPATASPLPTATSTATPTETNSIPATPTRIPCPGDCNADETVTADELILAVNIALAKLPLDECRPLDWIEDREVNVDEIVTAVDMALHGCTDRPPRTHPPLPTDTPGTRESPTPAPTRPPNRPPVIRPMGIYRAFPGREIQVPIGATDPDGNALRYQPEDLPEGADLDATSGVFRWTPSPQQIGPFYVSYTCTDDGEPPLSTQGRLVFQVSPLDECTIPTCDAATGCAVHLADLSGECCSSDASARVAQAATECPQGVALSVGRNGNGFGRMQNCDRFRVVNFIQTGAVVRFHVRAKCLNTDGHVWLHARMETSDRLLFDETSLLDDIASVGDFAEYRNISFPVGGDPPFFDLEGAEANFTVTVRDEDGLEVDEALRLQLTFDQLDDLVD